MLSGAGDGNIVCWGKVPETRSRQQTSARRKGDHQVHAAKDIQRCWRGRVGRQRAKMQEHVKRPSFVPGEIEFFCVLLRILNDVGRADGGKFASLRQRWKCKSIEMAKYNAWQVRLIWNCYALAFDDVGICYWFSFLLLRALEGEGADRRYRRMSNSFLHFLVSFLLFVDSAGCLKMLEGRSCSLISNIRIVHAHNA